MNIRKNNFDLIRLFAALQVVFQHALSHLKMHSVLLKKISVLLSAFPGVPIFFIISGFLITASYESNDNIRQYVKNRVLRIYPALWVAFILTVILIFTVGLLHGVDFKTFLQWSFCQLTWFQFYNPLFLRHFGVGVINGSLWTITVELQFYILVPLLYYLILKSVRWINRVQFFWALLFFSLCCNGLCGYLLGQDSYLNNANHFLNHAMVNKLLHVSVLPYLYCFLIGTLLRLHLDTIYHWIHDKFLYYLFIYLLVYFMCMNRIVVDVYHPLMILCLAFLVISFSWSFPRWNNVLKGNDFSYGIYIYHMLVINVFVFLGYIQAWYFFPLAFLMTLGCAILSWFLIEKTALKWKSKSLLSRLYFLNDARSPIRS